MAAGSATSGSNTRLGGLRIRWAAIGAAVAVTLGAGTIATVGAVTSSGERAIFNSISACRLMDTRSQSQVGPRGAALGSNDTATVTARGAQGNCTATDLPTDAVALQLNVTAVGATLPTFLAITPDGSTSTSSLNPVPGAPPTPNAVTVRLDAAGAFKIFNLQGDVDVIADVTGYYTDHDHDDRYYTEAESDGRYYSRADVDALLDERKQILIPLSAIDLFGPAFYADRNVRSGLVLPDGVAISAVSAITVDFVVPADYTPGTDLVVTLVWSLADDNCTVGLRRNIDALARPGGGFDTEFITVPDSIEGPGDGNVTSTDILLDDTEASFQSGDAVTVGVFRQLPDPCSGDLWIHGVTVDYD